jgi:hypothetical protein
MLLYVSVSPLLYYLQGQIYELAVFGITNENVAPFPSSLFSAHILPPWASTIFLDTNNPRPVPPESVETKL